MSYQGKIIGGFKLPTVSYLPISAARYNVSESFILGADLGYAIAISPSGLRSGMYYRPMVGYNLSDSMQLILSFLGISVDRNSVNSFGTGIMFSL